MKTELNMILQAINLADLDGLKQVSIEMKDLLLLKAIIKDMDKALASASREISRLEAKISLKDLDKPISFDCYKIDIRG